MRRIDLADAAFLLAEKRETPMHVGGVSLYTLPKGVDVQDFVGELTLGSLMAEDFREPFGEYVATGRAGVSNMLFTHAQSASWHVFPSTSGTMNTPH